MRRWCGRPGGEFDDKAGAAGWAVLDPDVASVAGHDGADDGEAEAAAAAVAGAAGVEAGESFEDPFTVAWGDAGAVVVDG